MKTFIRWRVSGTRSAALRGRKGRERGQSQKKKKSIVIRLRVPRKKKKKKKEITYPARFVGNVRNKGVKRTKKLRFGGKKRGA